MSERTIAAVADALKALAPGIKTHMNLAAHFIKMLEARHISVIDMGGPPNLHHGTPTQGPAQHPNQQEK